MQWPDAESSAAARGRLADRVLGRRARLVEQLQDRQHEGRRLAGPGLRAREDVAVRENVWDGFCLHGGWLRVALGFNGAKELGRQPEFGE